MGDLVVRKTGVEHIWRIKYTDRGFDYHIYVRGTESEVRAYMECEMGHMGAYTALTDKEKEAVALLKCPIYLAPQL